MTCSADNNAKREKARAYRAAWAAANPGKIQEYQARFRNNHPEANKEATKRYRARHPERAKQQNKSNYERNNVAPGKLSHDVTVLESAITYLQQAHV